MTDVQDLTSGLRVAMVIQRFRPHFTGQGRQLELLCRTLVKRGIKPTVITSAYGDSTSEELIDGYRVIRLHAGIPGPWGTEFRNRIQGPVFAVRTFAYLNRGRPFDLVHVHALTDALYGSWTWARCSGKPVLFEMTLLGVDDAVTALASPHHLALFRHAIVRRCDGYAAISPALERRYHDAGLPRSRVRLLPQGVNVHDFKLSPETTNVRYELGVSPHSPLLIFVGSLIRRKGIDVLLKAWKTLHRVHGDAHLVLVGRNTFPKHDPDASFLREQLTSLSSTCASHVHQMGVRDDVARLLLAADLFVFPSRREGFGTVMIEAMASGLPCVVTKQLGITDFIFNENGSTGTVIPQEDHAALATAVSRMLSNPTSAAEIGRAARRRAVARFDIEDLVERYIDFYSDLTLKRRTGRGA